MSSQLSSKRETYLQQLGKVFRKRSRELHLALKERGHAAKLMGVQDAVSKSLGFSSTHGLQQLLNRLASEVKSGPLTYQAAAAWPGTALLLSLQFLSHDLRDAAPMPRTWLAELHRIGMNLSSRLGLKAEEVLDLIAISWAGSRSWEALDAATANDRPLSNAKVDFVVRVDLPRADQYGDFVLNEDARKIMESEVMPNQPDPVRAQADYSYALKQAGTLASLAEAHPDLVQAWYEAGEAFLLLRSEDEAGSVSLGAAALFEEAVRLAKTRSRATSLAPSGATTPPIMHI